MIELLKVAKSDIENAEILFRSKKYSTAFYHFHQSVEKAVKYVGLSVGGISESQLNREIKHDPIKAFKIIFNYLGEQTRGIILQAPNPHMFTNAKNILNSTTEEERIKCIKEELTKIHDQDLIIDLENFSTPFEAFYDFTKSFPELNKQIDYGFFKNSMPPHFEKEIIKTINSINYGNQIFNILLLNSILLFNYKPDEMRYPSDLCQNPIEYFNEKNPIINNLDFFICSMKFPLEYASKIIWNN